MQNYSLQLDKNRSKKLLLRIARASVCTLRSDPQKLQFFSFYGHWHGQMMDVCLISLCQCKVLSFCINWLEQNFKYHIFGFVNFEPNNYLINFIAVSHKIDPLQLKQNNFNSFFLFTGKKRLYDYSLLPI
ncbi:hypothetical protein BpHYR1_045472 [Brachionus plicatilis]|uniref:Uncharacterized protein n=1 Tax=Brachionus plicatilis TaxID=10195 RepID=A0A3M7QGC5_BRAPC|nr:hypothetical protein BpHYR1_045472 [Brachionus plicatilis]